MLKSIISIISLFIFAIAVPAPTPTAHAVAGLSRTEGGVSIVSSVETSAYVNGKQITLRILTDGGGDLYFALRAFMEQLEYHVGWNAGDSSVDMENYSNEIKVTAGDEKCALNGETVVLDAPMLIVDGSSYFHQSFIAKVLGMDIVRVEMADGSDRVDKVFIETPIGDFWDNLVKTPGSKEFYWNIIDGDITDQADYYIDKLGAEALFIGLKSINEYSRYYCANRLVEFYNDGEVKARAIEEIAPLLNDEYEKVKDGAGFALSVLSGRFDSPYIINAGRGVRVFSLFNYYADYGSHNELWIIKGGALSKLYTFTGPLSHYIDYKEPMRLSPDKSKLAVLTCSRRSSSVNVIDLRSGVASPEVMLMALNQVAADNTDYVNTYGPDTAYEGGEYSFCRYIRWIDNDAIEFDAELSYNYGDIIERVTIKYDVSENSLEYRESSVSIWDD
jgi:hypothetical protein